MLDGLLPHPITLMTTLRPAIIEPLEDRVAPAAVLYMSLDFDFDGLTGLYQIDPVTGAATKIGANGADTATVGLTETTDPFVLLGSNPNGVVTINADGSGATQIGNLLIEALAMDTGTGILYGAQGANFFTVNIATGTNSGALASPGGDVEGLAFNGAGKIFGVDSTGNALLSYDIAGNAWTPVGPLGIDVDNVGFAFDPAGGVLYLKGLQDTNLYRVNPATGTATVVGNTGIAAGGGLALIDNGLKIVNPKTATYTDGDGDLVTVKVTQGTLTTSNFLLVPAPHGGAELWQLDLSDAAFKESNVTVTAKKTATGGDGLAHVGFLNGGTHDLGAVSIPGDLARIFAGDGDHKKPALVSLSVGSVGVIDLSKNLGVGPQSAINGDVGKLTVRGDFVEKSFLISRNLGPTTIGGSLRGGAADFSGQIQASGAWRSVTIGGSIIGGDGMNSGQIQGDLSIGSVRVAGAIVGGDGSFSGFVKSTGGSVGAVTIGQSIIGGKGNSSGQIFSGSTLGPVTIRGSLVGGDGKTSGAVEANGKLVSATIGGSVIGGVGQFSGEVFAASEMGPVRITGSVMGGDGSESGIVNGSAGAKSVTIGGSIVGGAGPKSGAINVGPLGAASVTGDVRGGDGPDSGRISAVGTLGPVKIGRSLLGGHGDRSGRIVSTGAAKTVTIGGAMLGDFGPNSGEISVEALDALTIGGDLRGGAGAASGHLISTGDIGSVKIGGSLIGGGALNSGTLIALTALKSVTIGGSIVGSEGGNSGGIYANGNLGAVTVAGSVIGGKGGSSGNIRSNQITAGLSGPVAIGGDLVGGAGSGSGLLFAQAGSWKSVTIGGSAIGGELAFSGAILAGVNLGKVTIKGSVSGTATADFIIRAGGALAIPTGATKNVAIESLTIGGSVTHTQVLVGFGLNNAPVNGGVQLGAVSVGGNWSRSSIAVGHTAGASTPSTAPATTRRSRLARTSSPPSRASPSRGASPAPTAGPITTASSPRRSANSPPPAAPSRCSPPPATRSLKSGSSPATSRCGRSRRSGMSRPGIGARLVAQRAAEEGRSQIRWRRPDLQNAAGTAPPRPPRPPNFRRPPPGTPHLATPRRTRPADAASGGPQQCGFMRGVRSTNGAAPAAQNEGCKSTAARKLPSILKGTDSCACVMRQCPSVCRRPMVSRNQKPGLGSPFARVPEKRLKL